MPTPHSVRRGVQAIGLGALACVAVPSGSQAAADWTASDGPYGGLVRALAVHPSSGDLYAGRSTDLHRTTDAGETWTRLGANTSMTNILDVAVGANGTILVGVSSRGAWWSTNGGTTWDNDQITHDPHSGQGASLISVIVTSNGTMIGGGFRSVNGGASWAQMSVSGYDYQLDANGRVIAGTQFGVHRSTNHGQTWTPINSGMETVPVWRVACAADGTLFAGSATSGVFRSTNDGASWEPVNDGLTDLDVNALVATPSGAVFVATNDGVFVSQDAGDSWQPTASPLPTPTAEDLVAHPELGLVAGTTGQGVWSSDDQGGSWSSHARGIFVNSPQNVARTQNGTYLVASFDAGVFRSTSVAGPWEASGEGISGSAVSGVVATADGLSFAATWVGPYVSGDDGVTWEPAGSELAGVRTSAILAVGGAVFAVTEVSGSTEIWRSTDGGSSWTVVFDASVPEFPAFLDLTAAASDGYLYTAGFSIFGQNVLYASPDLGESWEEHQPPVSGRITVLQSGAAGEFYLVGSASSTIHRSDDHGLSFTPLTPGPWGSETVTAVGASPDGRLFAATATQGVYVLEDAVWSLYRQGLPTVGGAFLPALFLQLVDQYLIAGFWGAGLYWNAESDPASAPDGHPDGAAQGPDSVGRGTLSVQAAPSPFSSATELSFRLETPGRLDVSILDVEGRVVRRLEHRWLPAGEHRVAWDGRSRHGEPLAPGVYFASIRAGEREGSARLLTLR